MKRLILIGLIITFIYSCSNKNESVNNIVISPILLTSLTETINHEDSLTNTIPTYGEIKSFKITFSETENKCFVYIEGDFDYYDSKAMNGYFMYKNKAVSIYGINDKCGIEFINQKKLRKGKIEGLKDFDYNNFMEAILSNRTPPPPPGEPYYRKYLIINNDSLKLLETRDDK